MVEHIEITPELVAGNSSVNIEVISEKGPYRAQNMVVPDEVASGFFVTDIKVGRNSQLVSVGAVPADYFARCGATEDLLFDSLSRGMTMYVCVTNMTAEAKKFSGHLRGELLPDRHDRSCPYKRIILGLGHTIVAAHSLAKIAVQAQVVCKPDKVVIPRHLLDGFKVKALRVAGFDAGQGELRDGMASFAPKIMQIGDWLCIEVENMTDRPLAFYGTVGGTIVQ
jgi:hypothetical protein